MVKAITKPKPGEMEEVVKSWRIIVRYTSAMTTLTRSPVIVWAEGFLWLRVPYSLTSTGSLIDMALRGSIYSGSTRGGKSDLAKYRLYWSPFRHPNASSNS